MKMDKNSWAYGTFAGYILNPVRIFGICVRKAQTQGFFLVARPIKKPQLKDFFAAPLNTWCLLNLKKLFGGNKVHKSRTQYNGYPV